MMAYNSFGVPHSNSVHDLTNLVEAKPRWEGKMESPSRLSPASPPAEMEIDVVEKATSTSKTIWNIANAVQGVSVMSLPYAVLRGGWVALGGFLVVAFMSNITGKFLIDCLYDKPLPSMFPCFNRSAEKDGISDRQVGNLSTNADTVGEGAPLIQTRSHLPVRVRSTYASIGQACWPVGGHLLVLLVQCVELLGVCSLSLVLMGSSIQMLFSNWAAFHMHVWIAICALAVLPTVLLPRLSQVSWLSLVGILTIFGVVVTILANSISRYSDWHTVDFDTPSVQHFPIALGIIIFGYAAHGQFPSMQIRMTKPMRFGFALNAAFLMVACLDLSLALLGYLAYGKDTKDILSLNMSQPWSSIVDVFLLTNLLVSYALPMFPVSALMDTFLRRYFPLCGNGDAGSLRMFYFVTTRIFLVGLTLFVAVSVPNFHLLMSFIGSITCVILVFVFPCVFHLVLHYKHLTLPGKLVDLLLVLVSTSAGLSGVYASYTDLMSA